MGLLFGVKDVSLVIEEGEIFVIMGFFGLGKFIMVCFFNCLIEFICGQVLIDGVDIVKMLDVELCEVCCKKIVMVFQFFVLMLYMSVFDNMVFGMVFVGVFVVE